MGLKTLTFKSSPEFRSWLEKNHADSDGFWLRISKKKSGRAEDDFGNVAARRKIFIRSQWKELPRGWRENESRDESDPTNEKARHQQTEAG